VPRRKGSPVIFLSLVLVIVAAVTLVLGVFQDGLVLIYVSIATCVAAMAVLGAGVLLRRREETATGPASYGDAGARDGAVARTSAVASRDTSGDRTTEQPAVSAEQSSPAEQETAVVRKVAATPAVADDAGAPAGDGEDPAASVEATAGEAAPVHPGDGTVSPTAAAVDEPAEADPEAAAATATAAGAAGARPTGKAAARKVAVKKATAPRATAGGGAAPVSAPAAPAAAATTASGAASAAPTKRATVTAASDGASAEDTSAATTGGRPASDLEQIRGLGPSRRARLLERFGSVEAIAAASISDLSAVPGIGAGLAEAIKDSLD
jgi:hypothetical protein